jgi:hypothetical protein
MASLASQMRLQDLLDGAELLACLSQPACDLPDEFCRLLQLRQCRAHLVGVSPVSTQIPDLLAPVVSPPKLKIGPIGAACPMAPFGGDKTLLCQSTIVCSGETQTGEDFGSSRPATGLSCSEQVDYLHCRITLVKAVY